MVWKAALDPFLTALEIFPEYTTNVRNHEKKQKPSLNPELNVLNSTETNQKNTYY